MHNAFFRDPSKAKFPLGFKGHNYSNKISHTFRNLAIPDNSDTDAFSS
jgi:hypothetical protein